MNKKIAQLIMLFSVIFISVFACKDPSIDPETLISTDTEPTKPEPTEPVPTKPVTEVELDFEPVNTTFVVREGELYSETVPVYVRKWQAYDETAKLEVGFLKRFTITSITPKGSSQILGEDIKDYFEVYNGFGETDGQIMIKKEFDFEVDPSLYELELKEEKQTGYTEFEFVKMFNVDICIVDVQNGSEAEPFSINVPQELISLGRGTFIPASYALKYTSSDSYTNAPADKWYKLNNDIDMSGKTIEQLADKVQGIFSGGFDGNKHIIKGLNLTKPFFGFLGGTPGLSYKRRTVIKDLGLVGVQSEGPIFASGSDVNSTVTEISHCFIEGVANIDSGGSNSVMFGEGGEANIESIFVNVKVNSFQTAPSLRIGVMAYTKRSQSGVVEKNMYVTGSAEHSFNYVPYAADKIFHMSALQCKGTMKITNAYTAFKLPKLGNIAERVPENSTNYRVAPVHIMLNPEEFEYGNLYFVHELGVKGYERDFGNWESVETPNRAVDLDMNGFKDDEFTDPNADGKKTRTQLKAGTALSLGFDADAWDFGTADQWPVLKNMAYPHTGPYVYADSIKWQRDHFADHFE